MKNPTVIVLFPANETAGRPALTLEKVDEDQNTVSYLAVFEKKTPIQGAAPEPAPVVEPQMADMSLSPEQVDAMSDAGDAELPS